MTELKDRIMNLVTYLFTGAGIIVNWESIEKFILFIGGCILLVLQIRLHLIKIRNEKNNQKED